MMRWGKRRDDAVEMVNVLDRIAVYVEPDEQPSAPIEAMPAHTLLGEFRGLAQSA